MLTRLAKTISIELPRHLAASVARSSLDAFGGFGHTTTEVALPPDVRTFLRAHRPVSGRWSAISACARRPWLIRQILSDCARRTPWKCRQNPKGAIPRELVVRYVVGATMALLTWSRVGAKLPPQQMDPFPAGWRIEGINRGIADLAR